MSLALLRADPAWRSLRVTAPLIVVLSAANAAFVQWQVREFLTLSSPASDFPQKAARALLLMVVIVSLSIGVGGEFRTGPVTEFGLSLPVRYRSLIAHRAAALLAHCWVPLAAAAAIAAALAPDARFRERLLLTATNLAAVLLAGVTAWLLLGVRSRRRSVGRNALLLGGVGGASALAAELTTAWFAVGALAVAAALGAALYAATASPPDFSHGAAAPRAASGIPRRAILPPLQWVLLRNTVLMVPAAVCGAAVVGLALLAARSGTSSPLAYLMPCLLTVLMAGNALQVLRKTVALPIDRRRILPWVVLPCLTCLFLGDLAGAQVFPAARGPLPAVDFSATTDAFGSGELARQVVVPPAAWKATTGAPPRVEAPWGEAVRPVARAFFPGSGMVAYNPYEIGAESSVRFAAWQLHRALIAVHGAAPSPEEIADRYLRTNALRRTDLAPGAAEAWRAAQPSTLRSDPRDVPARMIPLAVAWFLLMLLVLSRRTPPAGRSSRAILWTGIFVVTAPTTAVLAAPFLLLAVEPDAYARFYAVSFAALRDAFPSPAAAALTLLLIVAAAYVALARRFRFTETPSTPVDEARTGARMFLDA